MTELVLGVGVPLFLAFSGSIYAMGRLKQTVEQLGRKMDTLDDMRSTINDMSNRLTALEVTVGRRESDG